MTRIKLCGLSRPCDITAANALDPEYVGFVFALNSKRYVTPENAAKLKQLLNPAIKAAGVFVNEHPGAIAHLLSSHVIDIAQLHGDEDEDYIKRLRMLTNQPIIKAFCISTERDATAAKRSTADYVLLDSGTGAGTGTVFDWNLIKHIQRPYFLAGGLTAENVGRAVRQFHPYAVDVSSGIERNGVKDKNKMAAFVAAVRNENGRNGESEVERK